MMQYRPGVRGVVPRGCLAALPEATGRMGARHGVCLSSSYTRHAPAAARFVAEPKTLLETFVKALLKTFLKTFVKMVVKTFVKMVVKTQVSTFLKTQALCTREPAGTMQQEAWARRRLDWT